ncbi:MAG: hypothetical protein LBS87_00385 [Puniceicoccales bacterium]|jgi:exopolyphosphatase/guanosine-5'-triphosphate,3'-diphosphate pyrophosphatase|nr:hypothetical protein [Puniceicoccales bacterium]
MQKLINIVDIGTSSIKASVFECVGAVCKQVAFKSAAIRMVDQTSVVIDDDRQNLAIGVMKGLISFGQDKGTENTICIATYSIRSAKNAHNFLSKVKAETGMGVNVLSGREEAQFICDSVKNIEWTENFFSMDIGGGSVEFNLFKGTHIFSASKNIGAISLAELLRDGHLEPSLDNITKIVCESVEDIPDLRRDAKIICTGGCLVIAKRFFPMVDGKTVSAAEVKFLFEKISPMSLPDRLVFGIPEGKADIFDIALGTVVAMLSIIKRNEIVISEANVRHGVALNRASFMKQQ